MLDNPLMGGIHDIMLLSKPTELYNTKSEP